MAAADGGDQADVTWLLGHCDREPGGRTIAVPSHLFDQGVFVPLAPSRDPIGYEVPDDAASRLGVGDLVVFQIEHDARSGRDVPIRVGVAGHYQDKRQIPLGGLRAAIEASPSSAPGLNVVRFAADRALHVWLERRGDGCLRINPGHASAVAVQAFDTDQVFRALHDVTVEAEGESAVLAMANDPSGDTIDLSTDAECLASAIAMTTSLERGVPAHVVGGLRWLAHEIDRTSVIPANLTVEPDKLRIATRANRIAASLVENVDRQDDAIIRFRSDPLVAAVAELALHVVRDELREAAGRSIEAEVESRRATRVAEVEAEIATLAVGRRDAETALDGLSARIRSATAALRALEDEVSETTARMGRLRSEANAQEALVKRLGEERASVEAAVATGRELL